MMLKAGFLLQIDGREAEIVGQKCDKLGIKQLRHSKPKGPRFQYNPQTESDFGDQPLIGRMNKEQCDYRFKFKLDISKTLVIASELKFRGCGIGLGMVFFAPIVGRLVFELFI